MISRSGKITGIRRAVALVCALTLTAGAGLAQRPGRAVLRGTVVDSARVPLAGALVMALDTALQVIFETRTDSAGGFALAGLAAGKSYHVTVRKLGFVAGTARVAVLHQNDTLDLDVMLAPVSLAPVRVTATVNPEYHITAREIARAKHPLLDAYDVVLWLRPFMLGDVYQGCVQDTSTFTFGAPRSGLSDVQIRTRDPRKFTMGIGSYGLGVYKDGHVHVYKQDASGHPAADSSYPFRLYVNGARHDAPGAKNILSQIPLDDIAEMRYIDCWDTTTPQLRNSLIVVLKPGKQY